MSKCQNSRKTAIAYVRSKIAEMKKSCIFSIYVYYSIYTFNMWSKRANKHSQLKLNLFSGCPYGSKC